jgi:predicted NBD/HSP70 family sugar kinase
MRTKGLNSEQTKRSNRLLVLRLLSMAGGTSRTELTERVGLAKMTVSNIVGELIQSGVLYEKEPMERERVGAGRPQVMLSFSRQAPRVIGIWLSRDRCTGILANMNLEVEKTDSVELEKEENGITLLNKLKMLIRILLAEAGENPVLGVGIASIGPLDIRQGVLLNPPNFHGISHLQVSEELNREFHLPVFLENDTNAAAIAEKYFGGCREVSNFAYIGLTNGVSAGIVVRDSLLHGQHGFAGEIGHTVVNPQGKICYCGRRGCLETEITVPQLLRDAADKGFHADDFPALCNLCTRSAAAEEWFQERLSWLAMVLASLSNVIDPERLVIGHEGALLPDALLKWMKQQINGEVLAGDKARIIVQRSAFGTLAAVYGAAAVVLRQVFDNGLGYSLFFEGKED